jgi:hypothetical protein
MRYEEQVYWGNSATWLIKRIKKLILTRVPYLTKIQRRNIQAIWGFICFFHILLVLLFLILYMVESFVCFYLILYVMYSDFYIYVFLFLYMFRSRYCVSLCCSVYCLCVYVYCTTATGCQPNCSYQICHISDLSPKLRKKYSWSSTPPQGLHGLF